MVKIYTNVAGQRGVNLRLYADTQVQNGATAAGGGTLTDESRPGGCFILAETEYKITSPAETPNN